MKREIYAALTTAFLTLTTALGIATTPVLAQDNCVPSKDVQFCSADATTRLTAGPAPDTVAITTYGYALQGQTRIELPAGADSFNLSLQPPTAGFGDLWSLDVAGSTGEAVAQLAVLSQSGSTVITAAAEVDSWKLESFYHDQPVTSQDLPVATFQGSGALFDEISVRQDGSITYRWIDAEFQLADGTPIDQLNFTGSAAFGPLSTGNLTTTHDVVSLEDWLIKNRSVIGCEPVDWVEHLGSSYADGVQDVAAYAYGSIARGEAYITGHFSGNGFSSANFGFTPTNQFANLTSRAGTDDMFLAKLDDCGRWLWVRTGGSNQGADIGHAVAIDAQRNVVVVGTMSGTLTS